MFNFHSTSRFTKAAIAIAMVVLAFGSVYAATFYNIPNGSTTLVNEWSVPKNITNNCGKPLFVPTKTSLEWSTFVSKAPGCVTVANGAVNCTYTTYEGGSCSASCGGGYADTYYTIITPASGGGTCPVSEGQWAGWNGSDCNTQSCAVDCDGYWGSCSASCGGGSQTYTVTTPASNGGAACPASNGATQACNTQGCPGSWVQSGFNNFGPVCFGSGYSPCLSNPRPTGSCTVGDGTVYIHNCSIAGGGATDVNGSPCDAGNYMGYGDNYSCQ